ncbi:proton-coupled folate transporter-like [Pomacea canaliculata]|uniref:proton-coupled folate transporter-like n=1 Tax=Pomacea canaliculata TaxID=400727 RepID=UPI000D732435|nr:proton-coupled folate transporter-like [Pomacea canaliculata]
MIDGLALAAKSQYRYRFFHSKYASELHKYNVSKECGVSLQPEVQEIENSISRETIQWTLYNNYVTIVPHIVTALVMGLKSDQIGRRFVFLYPFITAFVDYILLAVILQLQLHFGFTLIGDFVRSLSGGTMAMSLAAYAVISDTHGKKEKPEEENKTADKHEQKDDDVENDLDMSREKQRTFKIVLLHVAHDLASSIISFATGYVIQYAGFFYTVCITLGLKILLFIFALLFITETGKQKKSPGFITPLKIILKRTKDPRNRRTLFLVNMAVVFLVVSFVTERETMTIYQMSPPFCMDAVQLGYLSSETRLRGIFTIPVLWLWRRLHFMESTIAAVGTYFSVAATFLLASVRQTWVFFVVPVVAIPGSLSSSMTKAITSRLVGRQALASSFAVMLAIDEVFSFGGGQAGNYLYEKFVDTVPTAPFYLAAATFAVSAAMYTTETILQRRYSRTDTQTEINMDSPTVTSP